METLENLPPSPKKPWLSVWCACFHDSSVFTNTQCHQQHTAPPACCLVAHAHPAPTMETISQLALLSLRSVVKSSSLRRLPRRRESPRKPSCPQMQKGGVEGFGPRGGAETAHGDDAPRCARRRRQPRRRGGAKAAAASGARTRCSFLLSAGLERF